MTTMRAAGTSAMAPKRVMGSKDAALYIGVSVDTVCEMARDGDLPAFRVRKLWKFRKDALDGWMAQREAGQKVQGKRG